jgi:hypothetical protein
LADAHSAPRDDIECMETVVPGTNCAELLHSMRLPFAEVVRVLMRELDFTYEEATAAASAVEHQRSERILFSRASRQ